MKKLVKKRMIRGNRDFCIYMGVISIVLAIVYERHLEFILLAAACFCGAYIFYSELNSTDWSKYEE